ncbi:GNAT family N-acetyltransferase [Butyricicoccus faecihominis]|uniref:GNAT family N-acetyltransferase n=1 Tax=Butyricicoccus faecihominis TaxID=1712515 RepID=UPI00247B1A09|nr:GNAT family N-acetyltransferase [Butyricicoccus faecihominis]MCQ5128818.1 GNAT family N-acetyltransferase [Butyricicoccus faecihominis]
MSDVILRVADEADAPAMLALYAPYVIETTVSSEYEPPSLEEFLRRMRAYGEKLPWLVCTQGDEVIGYGYASPHRTRAAYQWSVETSIYVAREHHRRGVAGAIYAALFELLAMQGYYNIYVGITSPNETSIKFHTAMGFVISGAYQDSMYKFGKWRDVLWMAKTLRAHEDEPQPTVPFPSVKDGPVAERVLRQAAQRIRIG